MTSRLIPDITNSRVWVSRLYIFFSTYYHYLCEISLLLIIKAK